jgi:hypothetical protein
LRFRIDAHQLLDLDLESGLFAHFTAHSLINGLSYLHSSPGQIPPIDIVPMR